MGWTGIEPRDGDVSFDTAYRDMLSELPGPVLKDQPPPSPSVKRAEERTRLEASSEDVGNHPELRQVESWAVFTSRGEPHLAVVLFRGFIDKGYLGWMVKPMSLDEGPYVSTHPNQELVDAVPVREDNGHEMDFRKRYGIYPAEPRPN